MDPESPDKVLVVDDDPTMQRVLTSMLGERWLVETAGDGRAALDACPRFQPDLILSDILMPNLDGFGLLREVRADPATRATPVIILSALAEEVDRLRALEAGATDFLIKPFSRRELLLRVGTQLEIQRLRREGARAEREALLQSVLDSALDAVVGFDRHGKVTYWNARAEQTFGWTRDEAMGLGLGALVAPDDGVPSPESLAAESARNQRLEVTGRRRDDQTFPMELALLSAGGSPAWSFTAFARDVTEARRAERERGRLLEDARRANQLKDEFLATLSHELRTPLNAILGWAHMLRTGTLDEAGVARAVETIDRNARIQNQIIGDILDISRIIAGKLHLDIRPVDLRRVIEAALDTVRHTADLKGIRLSPSLGDGAPPAAGDPDRLQQVVWNLLSNAIKFTPRGGEVRVALRTDETQAEISVQDTGAGIAPEFIPHVFERFQQAEGFHAQRMGGLGLGLAIVHHLIELHGGTAEARSPGVGRGSTFVVRIPLLSATATGHRIAALAEGDSGLELAPRLDGIRVLVLEDEPEARELVATVLRQRGAVVLTAPDAEQALDVLDRDRPDVLVCDLGLPGADGYEFIRRVRALPADKGGRIPATALSAWTRAEDRTRALLAGYQMHVPKPAPPAELVTVVSSLADRRRG